MNPFKTGLAKTAGIYTISNILNSAIPFLIMPVLTRYLSPTDYGLTATFLILVGFVAPFTGLSIHGAIARKYYDRDDVDFPSYISSCLAILLVSSVVVGTVFWMMGGTISQLAVFPRSWLWAVIIVSVCEFIFMVTLTLWQVESRALQYGIFQNFQSIVNAGLSICLIVGFGMNWVGRVWAQVAAGLVTGLIGLVVLWRFGVRPTVRMEYVRSALAFGIPLIPHAFGGWVMAATDRIFINNMVGVAESGVYTVGFQFAMIIGLLQVSFNTAWGPWLFKKLGENNLAINLKIVKFTYVYVLAMLVMAMVVALAAPWFLAFFVGKDFRGAGKFIFWLVLARGVESMYYMTCNYIFYSKKTGYIALATFVSAVIHVGATYMLVRHNGAIGAAQATFVSSVVLVALVWLFAVRLHKMPWMLGWSARSINDM